MHIENNTVTVISRPEELKSIISVEEKLLWPSIVKDQVVEDSSPPPQYQQHALKSKRVPTMPKRYLPYQLEKTTSGSIRGAGHTKVKTAVVQKKREEEEEKVVTVKSVGSNGLVFMSSSASEVELEESSEADDDLVDVETCDNNILDGDRKTVVDLKQEEEGGREQEEKEPVRKRKTTVERAAAPYAGKDVAGGCSPPTNQANTMAFVAILLHALKCSSTCEKPACRKMIMVLQHYKHCAFKRKVSLSEGSTAGQNCKICAQLLRIVALHAKNDCKMHPTQLGCPVLMCDTFRMAGYANKVKMQQQQQQQKMKVQQHPKVNNLKLVVDKDTKKIRGGVANGRRVVVTQKN